MVPVLFTVMHLVAVLPGLRLVSLNVAVVVAA